ncbi:MAG TPA: DUF2089 domain-containing protein [Thermomicrobiaceae bacterium]|nr:DUF2089 domain-containing protein [Thermomicrobiaceae bacterium]
MLPAPQQCPTCGHPLELRELSCPACETVVRGRWAASPFSRLSPEQQTFLRLFVRSRGNLSEVERTLGVSYPTVRAKLEEVIELLGEPETAPPAAPAPAPPARPSARDELLQRIARGELGVDEGLARLGKLTEES